MSYTVGIVGTGQPGNPDRTGFAMAYEHAAGYGKLAECELVACADIVPENAERFAEEHGLPDSAVYESHDAMLADAAPDIVSVTVPPAAHADIVIDCARAGVEAVHCEKPMADTPGDARLMAQECARRGVQLTINHQRRFGKPFRRARELVDAGEIGDVTRVEFDAGNLCDYGTHSFDLSNYLVGDRTPEWVLAGIDYHEENLWFGMHNENEGVALWEYPGGVFGFAATGGPGEAAVDCHNRVVGTEGTIEIGRRTEDAPPLRIRRAGQADWETVDTDGEGMHGSEYHHRAIADLVECLDADREPELRAERALSATELVFGAWESARRRRRVEFPLAVEENPLAEMVESGEIELAPREE
ncbi:MAG: Gfo/Idh/MocA family protein [Halobacteriaceae archaeon]